MKRVICLLAALCLLAASASAPAESPALTEGEQKALEMLAQAKLDAVINRIPDEEIRRSLQEG